MKIGDRVRVVACEDAPELMGRTGEVIGCREASCDVALDGDAGVSWFARYELAPVNLTTTREAATAVVARAEAALADARTALRAAWVAEIAALPPIPPAGRFDEVVAAVTSLLGEPQWPHRCGDVIGPACWGHGGLYLFHENRVDPMRFDLHAAHRTGSALVVPVGTLDVSLRRALTWLAERGVFLLDR